MSTPIRTWTVAEECSELQGLLSKTITRMPSTRKLSWEKCDTMASWLARLVLSKKEHCSGEMQVSRAVCYPWVRTVQCFSECSRRYSYHFQVFLWHALQDCFWDRSSPQAQIIQGHTMLNCCSTGLAANLRKKFCRNSESAKTINMFLSSIYLNICFPRYSSSTKSLGVGIL